MINQSILKNILNKHFPNDVADIIIKYSVDKVLDRYQLINALIAKLQIFPIKIVMIIVEYTSPKIHTKAIFPSNKENEVIKTDTDVALRIYYNNRSMFYVSSSGRTYLNGRISKFIDSFHVIISYYISEWKITIPLYIIINENGIADEVEKDDNMIHFYHSPDYANISNGITHKIKSKTKSTRKKDKKIMLPTKFEIEDDKVIVINQHERNFLNGKNLSKTIYLGSKRFLEKLSLLEFKKKKAIDVTGIGEDDYWFIDLSSEMAKLKCIEGEELTNLIELDSVYKQIIIIREIVQKKIKRILKKEKNYHTAVEKIGVIFNKYIININNRLKTTLNKFNL